MNIKIEYGMYKYADAIKHKHLECIYIEQCNFTGLGQTSFYYNIVRPTPVESTVAVFKVKKRYAQKG